MLIIGGKSLIYQLCKAIVGYHSGSEEMVEEVAPERLVPLLLRMGHCQCKNPSVTELWQVFVWFPPLHVEYSLMII